MSGIMSFVRAGGVVNGGVITTIFGSPGVGKTTVAYHCFPSPLFIPIEPGLLSVPGCHSTTPPANSNHVQFFLDEIEKQIDTDPASFPYKTIVLDSISELDSMIAREVCISNRVESISALGWGKGHSAVANRQREIKEICSRLAVKGLHIVAICHADIKEIYPPDSESYTIWTLQLVRGSLKEWCNQTDCVIHVKSKVSLASKKGDHVVAKDTILNERILDMVTKPSSVAKNRFGIRDEIKFVFDPATGSYNNPLVNLYR